MRKTLFSLIFIISALFTSQILVANENVYLKNDKKVSKKVSKDIEMDVSKLTSGNLKKEVTKRLGSRKINDITKLTVSLGNVNNNDFAFIKEELENLEILDLSQVMFDDSELQVTFNQESKIKEFDFPKSSKGYMIADNFFKDNSKISEINLNAVNSIGKFAFENTKSLRNIDLSKVDSFDEGLFIKSGIENVTFKDGFDLSKNFFKDTTSLSNIDISKAKTIGEGVFINSAIEFVKMPSTYALEGYTFSKTKKLLDIDLSGATRLGTGDFMESNIEEVIFPSSYALPDFYFAKTENLSEIDISSANKIGAGVFAFSNIEKISLPSEYVLGEGSLQYTEKLKSLDVSNTSEFEEAIFAGSSLEKIIMPDTFEVSNSMFAFMDDLRSIDLSGTTFLNSNIFAKVGNNYDFYRKFFDGNDLASNIETGVETVIFGKGVVPSVSKDSFANLNNKPPLVLMPNTNEWDGFSYNIMDKENEIETQLRYDAFTYSDLMISKNTLIQIGFINPVVVSSDDEDINVKYQWYFNDKEIVNGNQSTFTVDNFSLTDEGSYRLEIIADNKVYSLAKINLEANELAIDSKTLHKGYFVDEEIDESNVSVLYVKDDIRRQIEPEDLEYEYDFSEVGNTSIKITYTNDDLVVVADYPVKVASELLEKIRIKKGESFSYDPKIDDFEFVVTSNQKEFFDVETENNSTNITITAKEKYQGELDFKFNDRVDSVEIEIVNNFFFLWIGLAVAAILGIALMIYLRKTKGMFKIKREDKE